MCLGLASPFFKLKLSVVYSVFLSLSALAADLLHEVNFYDTLVWSFALGVYIIKLQNMNTDN